MIDPDGFATRLAAFLTVVEEVIPDLNAAPHHVGFPAGSTTLMGSELGRQVWLSSQAERLVSFLLQDSTLSDWFQPPPESKLVPLRFFFGSVVARRAQYDIPIAEFVATEGQAILEALLAPELVATGVLVAYGLETTRQINLPYGLLISPATPAAIARLMADVPADLLRMPQQPTVLLVSFTKAAKAEWAGYATAAATSSAYTRLEGLRHAVWLATGRRLGRGHTIVFEPTDYPSVPQLRVPPRPEQQMVITCDQEERSEIDAKLLWEIIARLGSIWGRVDRVADQETHQALRIAEQYLPIALESPDARITTLLSYAALDGLLLRTTDDDSRLGPRVAWLVGHTVAERKWIRRLLQYLYEIRGAFAHGEVVEVSRISAMVERELDRGDPLLTQQEIQKELRLTSLGLLRRVLTAFLWLAFRVHEPSDPVAIPDVQPDLTRGEILDLLESAEANDCRSQAFLEKRVPPSGRIWNRPTL